MQYAIVPATRDEGCGVPAFRFSCMIGLRRSVDADPFQAFTIRNVQIQACRRKTWNPAEAP